jgi:hypothetical protein
MLNVQGTMPERKDKWYHTIFRVPSKEEVSKKIKDYEEHLKEKYARRLRKDERFLQEEGDEFSSS